MATSCRLDSALGCSILPTLAFFLHALPSRFSSFAYNNGSSKGLFLGNKGQNIEHYFTSSTPTVVNPLTNRKITIGKCKFKSLIAEGGWVAHNGEMQRLNTRHLSLDVERKDDEGYEGDYFFERKKAASDSWFPIIPTVFQHKKSAVPVSNSCLEDVLTDALFVNKPSGLHCVPAKDSNANDSSLACLVRLSYPDAKLCHRLDVDTSGIVVFGLTPDSHREISHQFESRKVSKIYVALVDGHPSNEEGSIDIPIGKIKSDQGYNRWALNGNKSREAKTKWRLEKSFLLNGAKFSRLELLPLTGRGHQLRLHLEAIGHPILGDTLHAPQHIADAAPRLCLHARKLVIQYKGFNLEATSISPF